MFDSDLRTQLKVAQRLEQMSSSGTQPVENSITFIEEAVSIRRELIAQNDLDPATRRAMEAGLARSLLPLGQLQLRAAATVDDGARSIVESVALLRGAARAEAAGEAASMKKQRKSRALVLFSALLSLASARGAIGRRDAAPRALDEAVALCREALALRVSTCAEEAVASADGSSAVPPHSDVAVALRALAMALGHQKHADVVGSGSSRIDEAIDCARRAKLMFTALGAPCATEAKESEGLERLLRGLRPARAERVDAEDEAGFALRDGDDSAPARERAAAAAARAWAALPAPERSALLERCAAHLGEADAAKAEGNTLLGEGRLLEAIHQYRDVALTPCARALSALRKVAPPLPQLARDARRTHHTTLATTTTKATTSAAAAAAAVAPPLPPSNNAVTSGDDETRHAAADGPPLDGALALWARAQTLQVSLWLNLAQCCLKQEQFGSAAKHCGNVLTIARLTDGSGGPLAKQATKALYRRALARSKDPTSGTVALNAARADIRRARELSAPQRNAAVERLAVALELLRAEAVRTEEPLFSMMAKALQGKGKAPGKK